MQLKHSNRYRNNNHFKNNDDANTRNNDGHNKNMCCKKGHNHEWHECPDNPKSKITSTETTASVGTNEAKTDLGTMADGARGTVTIIVMLGVEIAIGSATIMAIGIPEAETEKVAKAVARRCPAQKHGVSIAPLEHPLSVLTKLGAPSVGVPDAQ